MKQSHQDESEYRNVSLEKLELEKKRIQKRLDRLYDDKLDEKIDDGFYDRKFKQYSAERDSILESMKKHTVADKGHFETGINLFRLSQDASMVLLSLTTILAENQFR